MSGPLSEVGIRMRVVDLARACGSVLGRQGNPFGVPRTEVRGSLDRLRSLPHSAAMIDALLRGRLPPAPSHAPTSTVARVARVGR